MTKEEQLITRASELGATVEIGLKHGRFFGRASGRNMFAHAYGPSLEVTLLGLIADLEVQHAEALAKAACAQSEPANETTAAAQ
jgi:hypothetical protein